MERLLVRSARAPAKMKFDRWVARIARISGEVVDKERWQELTFCFFLKIFYGARVRKTEICSPQSKAIVGIEERGYGSKVGMP
jgi:hypothetical protein